MSTRLGGSFAFEAPTSVSGWICGRLKAPLDCSFSWLAADASRHLEVQLGCWQDQTHLAYPCGLGSSWFVSWVLRGNVPRASVPRDPDFLCPRLGSYTGSLPQYSAGQSNSQAQPRFRMGKTPPPNGGCCNQLWSYLINHTVQTIYIPHTWNRYSSPLKALKHSMRFSIRSRLELLEELVVSNTEIDALYKWSSSGVDPWARLSLSHPFFLWEMSCFCSWVAFQHASCL